MKSAISDYRALPGIEVEHRRKAEVHALRCELRCDDPPEALGFVDGFARILVPTLSQRTHRGQIGEAVAKALNPAAFVIDGDQQPRLAQREDRVGKISKLARRGVLAREQDDSAHRRMQ